MTSLARVCHFQHSPGWIHSFQVVSKVRSVLLLDKETQTTLGRKVEIILIGTTQSIQSLVFYNTMFFLLFEEHIFEHECWPSEVEMDRRHVGEL